MKGDGSVFRNSLTRHRALAFAVVVAVFVLFFEKRTNADEDAGVSSSRRSNAPATREVSFPTDKPKQTSLLKKFMKERTDTGKLLEAQIRRKQEILEREVEESQDFAESQVEFYQRAETYEEVTGLPEFPMLGNSNRSVQDRLDRRKKQCQISRTIRSLLPNR